jgi:hypothetical protein
LQGGKRRSGFLKTACIVVTTINIADKRAYFNSSAAKNGNFSPGIEVPLEKKGTGCYNMTMSS